MLEKLATAGAFIATQKNSLNINLKILLNQ